MATETEIVNAALRKTGGKRILDIGEDVASAGIASDVMAQERDNLLRLHNWNFAISRKKLARLSEAPVFGFDYAFSMPTACASYRCTTTTRERVLSNTRPKARRKAAAISRQFCPIPMNFGCASCARSPTPI